jgi:hypothetical protein
MPITFRGASSAPSSAAGKVYFNSTYGSLQNYSEMGDTSAWRAVADTGNDQGWEGWQMRVVYVQGYMMGGYRSSSPWKNVNRTVHATDVTTNLGDIMDVAGAYCTGGFSDTRGYMYASDNSFPGTTTHVSAMGLFTETGATMNGSLTDAKDDLGQFQHHNNTKGWCYGGNADDICSHTFSTESFSHIGNYNSDNHHASNCYGDGKSGYMPKGSYKMQMESETVGTMVNVVGAQTHSKALPTKHYRFYVENNGNSTSTNEVYRYNVVTDTNAVSPNFKPWVGGETNYEQGQYHGYGLGHCGIGCQSNHSFKTYFFTDAHVAGGTTMEPKGQAGASSGGNASRIA